MFEGTKTYTKEEAASGEGRNQIEIYVKMRIVKKISIIFRKGKQQQLVRKIKHKGNLITKVNDE